jgi:protein-disulfide isomerase
MYLQRLSALATLVVMWAELASAASVAARIGGEEISTTAVDAISSGEVERIHSRLTDVARAAVQELISERLGIGHALTATDERARIYRAHDVTLTLPEAPALETALPPDQVVAVTDGDAIRAGTLENVAALRLYRLRGELYLQRRRNLDVLIERHLLQLEAESRGVSLHELEQSFARAEPVTDVEVQDFVSRERAAGRTIEDPERVRPYLAFQKTYQRRSRALQVRRAQTQIQIELRPPARPRLPLETEGGVALGAGSEPVLVAYTNYSCKLCRATHQELDKLLASSRPPRIVLRDLAQDPVASDAAALVRCAAKNARAAEVRRLLLRSDPPAPGKPWFGADEMTSVAQLARMTPSSLRACTESSDIRARIEQDTQAAHRIGFDDPPGFVADGVPLSGMQTAERLEDALSGRADPELAAY